MANDIFGDLQNWGHVLDQMGRLAREGSLDQHQAGLARVARYPFNWRLREAALRTIGLLKEPTEEVIEVVLRILTNEHGDLDMRILAGDALARLLSNGAAASMSDRMRCRIAQSMQDILGTTGPPVLHAAAQGWREQLQQTARVAAITAR